VTTAINGVLGLSTYTSSPHGHFAAVLSDAEMPVLDGFGMCTQLRAWEAANNIAHPVPVVLLSAHSANVSWERAAQAGFTQLHGKPIDMLRLGDVLIEVTDPEGEQVLLRDRPLPRSMVVEEDDDSD
jgi:CheY-like chemotaxis protein